MSDLIRDAYNRCKVDEWLEYDDKRYVDLHALGVRGDDHSCMDFLYETITLRNDAGHLLFSGFRGSGKTTELKRLARRFEDNDYNVVYIDTEEYLNLHVPATVSDILITIAAGMDRHLHGTGPEGERKPFHRFWDRLRAFLNTRVSLEKLNVTLPEVAELELAFTEDIDFKSRLYQSLEGRTPELAKECRAFMDECLGVLAGRHKQGTVLIIDSYEKLRGTFSNAAEVHASVEDVFVRNWHYLKTPCHAIYTVPPWLTFMEAGASAESGRIHILPMCKVTDRETGQPHEPGVQAMMQILGKRMPLEKIFEIPDALRLLILGSGGYPRDLLRMVQELLQRARMSKLTPPLPGGEMEKLITRVLDAIGETYEKPIADEDIELLVRVGRNRDITGHARADLLRLADLFDSHFVMSYRNGHYWFDLHPLVRRSWKLRREFEKKTDE